MATDLQLRNDVLAEIARDPSIEADRVAVAVHDGVVLVSGELTSFAEKHAAGRAVHRVPEVKAVVLDVHVALPAGHRRCDAEIAHAVGSAFARHPRIPRHRLHVQVEGGWVTLTGEVDWEIQRHIAEVLAAQVTGVEQVFNQIALLERERPGRADAPAHGPASDATVQRSGASEVRAQADPRCVADPAAASPLPPASAWPPGQVTGVLSGLVGERAVPA